MTDQEREDLIRRELAAVDGREPSAQSPLSKHVRMARSPFRFFRGSAQLFYADLASGLLKVPEPLLAAPLTRIQGDCHFSNFGFLTEEGSHGDRVIFCPNDYDDAAGGHGAWDLLRFSTSLLLAAEYARGVRSGTYETEEEVPEEGSAPTAEDAEAAIHAFLGSYARTCASIVEDPDERERVVAGFSKQHALSKAERKARRRTVGGKDFATRSTLAKDTEVRDGRLVFRDIPGRFERLPEAEVAELKHAFMPYVDDTILDVVRRLGAGTGSLELERYYLLVGPEHLEEGQLNLNHVVEVKRQRPASLLRHFPDIHPHNRLDPAHLTVDCQRAMQRRPDLVLDEAIWRGQHWLVRSRHHARVSLDPEALLCEEPGRFITEYAEACGEALALAHSRGDRRSTEYEATLAQALGVKAIRRALAEAAAGYAERAAADQALLRRMLGMGATESLPGGGEGHQQGQEEPRSASLG